MTLSASPIRRVTVRQSSYMSTLGDLILLLHNTGSNPYISDGELYTRDILVLVLEMDPVLIKVPESLKSL